MKERLIKKKDGTLSYQAPPIKQKAFRKMIYLHALIFEKSKANLHLPLNGL